MFAMVLAIGILVDDAIVVVENVERIMAEEGLSPKEATRKAMKQITGAIIGITLVLTAVFMPMAFFPGAVGVIYQQFSLTMVVSILFSGFLALSLTPALCATFLKPIAEGPSREARLLRLVQPRLRPDDATAMPAWSAASSEPRRPLHGDLSGACWSASAGLFLQLPSSFLPNEDQGFLIVDIQAPPEASSNRTRDVIDQIEAIFARTRAPSTDIVVINGFCFSGAGENAGLAFVTLQGLGASADRDNSATAIASRVNGAAVPAQGCDRRSRCRRRRSRVSARRTASPSACRTAPASARRRCRRPRDQLIGRGRKSPILAGLRIEGMPDAAQVNLIIDREKANAFGVSFADINSTISANLGSSYVNDFPNAGRMQRVTVQARRRTSACRPTTCSSSTCATPMAAWCRSRPSPRSSGSKGPAQVVGYNGYPSIRISGAGGARLFLGRGDRRDGAAGRPNCRTASATNGPASRCRKSSPARRRRCWSA